MRPFHGARAVHTHVGTPTLRNEDDAAQVARQGFDAVMKGEDKGVAGSLSNKLMAASTRVLPDAAKTAMHRHLTEKDPNASHNS